LKRSVIKQNIILFKARLEGVSVSYTFIKKWIPKFFENIVDFFRAFLDPLFVVIFVYSMAFILFLNFYEILWAFEFNYSSLALFLLLIVFYILLYSVRNIIILLLNFAIFVFIIIFWVINF
jgi:hypothetical protein